MSASVAATDREQRMTNGLTHGGRKLSADEVPSELRHHYAESPSLPKYVVPRYRTDGYLFTRDELLSLFEQSWGKRQVNDGDVDAFLKVHFFDHGRVVPTDTIPFPAMADIDEDVDDRTREKLIADHESRRRISRRAREVFDITGLPYYVPSYNFPSPNDRPDMARHKADTINNLGR